VTLEEIQNLWKKDSKIDEVLLDESTLRIPQLHHKYLTLHSEYTLLVKKKQQELRTLEHRKWLYYSGKAAPEEYEEKPFEYKVIKSDVQHWVGVDEQIQKVEMQIDYYNTTVSVLSEILKQIHQMSYNIKNAIEWRRFTGGVG
jgi:small-conductance mechanosensitive channel